MSKFAWAWGRRLTQALALLTVVLAPFFGEWQRLARDELGSWSRPDAGLPTMVARQLEENVLPYELDLGWGGGSAMDWFSVAAVDPVFGSLALLHGGAASPRSLIAWMIPLLLAVVAGRVFCGWLCPFGTLARAVDSALDRLPRRPQPIAPPRRRWVRFAILGVALALGAAGLHALLVFSLPHLLVQQAVYGIWVEGGGGAALGAALGLLIVGVVFGPTIYCSTVCPTGAVLGAVGRARLIRLRVIEPTNCGPQCDLCDRACWLFLQPSAGDPGPDCDICGRCTRVCPKDNLRLRIQRPWSRFAAAIVFVLPLLGACGEVEQAQHREIVLRGVASDSDVEVHASAIREDASRTVEVSAYIARGVRGKPTQQGRLPPREVYDGPLQIVVRRDGAELASAEFDRANAPLPAARRTIYRAELDVALASGDAIEVGPIAGWTSTARFVVDDGPRPGRVVLFAVVGALILGGLTLLSLAARGRPEPQPPNG